MQPNHHAAISNDFSIKNSSCSPTAKSPPSVCSYFYQKQLMQPNCQIPTLGMQLFLSKTAHAAQLPNPHPRYAAISIKNSSCSPTAKSPPSVCSYFYQKQLMQPNCQIPTLGMQLFLSKTAHATKTAQIPTLGMQLFLSKTAHATIPTLGMQPIRRKKRKKNHHQHHLHLTTTTTTLPTTYLTTTTHHHHHLLILPPPAHTPPTKHPLTHTLHQHISPPPSPTHTNIHPPIIKPYQRHYLAARVDNRDS
jgi:hypothetical protein